MSTWAELFKADGALDAAAKDLARRWSALLGRAAGNPFDPNEEVGSSSLLVLLVWAKYQEVEKHYHESTQAERNWTILGSAAIGGQIIRYYKNRAGELVELPEAFLTTFLAGKRLDCELREDEKDTSWVKVVRGGKVQARLPKTLLDYLVELRKKQMGPPSESRVPFQPGM